MNLHSLNGYLVRRMRRVPYGPPCSDASRAANARRSDEGRRAGAQDLVMSATHRALIFWMTRSSLRGGHQQPAGVAPGRASASLLSDGDPPGPPRRSATWPPSPATCCSGHAVASGMCCRATADNPVPAAMLGASTVAMQCWRQRILHCHASIGLVRRDVGPRCHHLHSAA